MVFAHPVLISFMGALLIAKWTRNLKSKTESFYNQEKEC